MMSKLRVMSSVVAFVLCLTAFAFGQETTGSIEGSITDTTGARVPGATVHVVGQSFDRTATADGEGVFRILQIPPGIYTISTNANNFRPERRDNVQVVLGQATITDISLQTGGVNEEVVVSATDVAAIDTSSSKVATNVTERAIELTPKGTNFSSVLKVSPATRSEPLGAGFQIDGSSGAENTFIIDGSEVTNFRTGQLRNVQNIPFELVKEVQIKTSGFEAEYGGATGGVINVVTKGGGNQFHGQAGIQFENDRFNSATRATQLGSSTALQYINPSPNGTTFFNPPDDTYSNKFPSATVSGPVVKDKLFFFVSTAPQFFHTERRKAFTDGTTADYSTDVRRDYTFARLDATPFDKLRLSSTYLYNPQREHGQLAAFTSPTNPGPFDQRGGRVAAANYTFSGNYTATSALLFSARYGRNYLNEKDSAYGVPTGLRLRCPNSTNTGVAGVVAGGGCTAGFDNIGSNSSTSKDISIRNTFDVDASYLVSNFVGRHSFKFGYQLNKLFNDVDQGFFNRGRIDFFFGQTSRGIGGGAGQLGNAQLTRFGTVGKAGSKNQALYAQDSWNPFSRLTLNLGFRIEKEDVPTFSATGQPIKFGFRDKPAPRLGFAYDLRGNGRTKIFGSYGFFYDRFKYELPRGSFGGDQFLRTFIPIINPNVNTYTAASVLATPGALTLDFRVPSNDPADNRIDPNLKAARQSEFTVGVEQELLRELVLRARYTHKQVDHAIEDVGFFDAIGNENFFIANPGEGVVAQTFAPGLPATPKAERKYDAFEVAVDKRFSRNYYLSTSYTYSRLFGNYSGLASSDERGRSSPNVNRFFDLPFLGFNINGQPDNGRLATDRPHAFKFFGGYTLDYNKSKSNSTDLSLGFIGLSGTPLSTRVSFFNAQTFLDRRGDLGRTEKFTQTDLLITHRIRFGDEGRYGFAFEANFLNLFNQNHVTDRFTTITPSDLSGSGFTIPGNPNDELDAIRAVFNGADLRAQILNRLSRPVGTAGRLAQDVRYNQPLSFQDPRTVRFAVRFLF